jgi:GTPase SAR1 family protein
MGSLCSSSHRTLKVALIGTAASGKSTFFKQMHHLYTADYNDSENENYLRILINNFFTGLKELVNAVDASGNKISKNNKKNAKFFQEYSNVDPTVTDEIIQQARDLWADEEIQKIWEQKDSLPNFTITNFRYLMDNIERLAEHDAVPTHDDIVRCRQRTTGLYELTFPFEKYYFHIFDIGGQKPERKKWPIIIEQNTPSAVLYFASLTDWDIPLAPGTDSTVSRMDESLQVWEECLNQEYFSNKTIILCLNKTDIFDDKIEKVDLSETFKKFKGEGDEKVEKAREFIKDIYMRRAKKTSHAQESIYCHFTCAIDTTLIGGIFEHISQEIIWCRLKDLQATV